MKKNIGLLALLTVFCFISTASSGIINPVVHDTSLNPNLVENVDYQAGKFILKLTPAANENVSVSKSGHSDRSGIIALDNKLASIEAIRFGPAFPFVIPPLPDGSPSELTKMYVVEFSNKQTALSAAALFNTDPLVEYAHPFYNRYLSYTPNDTLISRLWYLDEIRAYQAWDITRGRKEVVIAIVDTGVDWDHPDLAENIYVNPGEDLNGNNCVDDEDFNGVDDDANGLVDDLRGYDFVDDAQFCDSGSGEDCDEIDNNPMDLQGHGSHCAGDAGAVGDNYAGIPSVGFGCSIMPLRNGYLGQNLLGILQFSIDSDASFQGVAYAGIMGAEVISCSWGGGEYGQAEQDVITDAYLRGSVMVAAAGNGSTPTAPDINPQYPAAYQHVVSVAATGGTPGQGANTNRKADFTTYGPWVDISTPGVDIFSTVFNNQWISISGTSMATPITAGAIGLIRSRYPNLSAQETIDRLLNTADYDALYSENLQQAPDSLGAGLLDVYAAVGPTQNHPENLPGGAFLLKQNYPNPFNPATAISYTLYEPALVSLRVYNPTGRLVEILEDNIWKLPDVYRIEWNRTDHLSSGIYFYRLSVKPAGVLAVEKQTRKMLLLK